MTLLREYVCVLLESRPTPLDKRAIARFARELLDELEATLGAPSDEPLGEHGELVASSFSVGDVRTGEPIAVPVYLRSYEDDVRGVFLGAGAGRVDGELIVEVLINGRYSTSELFGNLKTALGRDIYEALLHELTHVADHRYDSSEKLGYFRSDGSIDDAKYHNDPREVRAFLQEAVDEALTRAERRRDLEGHDLIRHVTSGPVVRRLRMHMERRNFVRVLKAIYVALRDAGKL